MEAGPRQEALEFWRGALVALGDSAGEARIAGYAESSELAAAGSQ